MKKFKKVMAVVSAVMVLTSAMAGCAGSDTKKNADTDTAENAPQVTFENAPKVVMAIRNLEYDSALMAMNEKIEDNPYVRYIFEKTGVRLYVNLMPNNDNDFRQKIAVELAGGNTIDLIQFFNLQQPWIDTGTIIKVNDLLEKYKDKIPNINKNIPDSAWQGVKKLEDIWGVPIRGSLGKQDLEYFYFRKDWLDKLNLQMPKTTDDIGNILKAFTENDPDGNGKKDTLGLGLDSMTTLNKLMQIWGVDTYREDIVSGNKLVSMAYSDRARYAYKTLGTWFKNGYMDQEGVVDKASSQKKRVTDKIGVYFGLNATINKNANELAANGFKDAKWVMLDTPIISSFDNKAYGTSARSNFSNVTMITSVAKDYDSIMKLLDWGYSEEGTTFLEYGLAGREHNVVDGKMIKDAQIVADKKTYLSAFLFAKSYNHAIDTEAYLAQYNGSELAKQYIDVLMTKVDTLCWRPTDIKYQYPDLTAFTTYPDWRKGVETYGNKFFLGDLDPMDDKVWKEFIDASDKYGMQILMDEAAKRHFKQ